MLRNKTNNRASHLSGSFVEQNNFLVELDDLALLDQEPKRLLQMSIFSAAGRARRGEGKTFVVRRVERFG